MPACRTAEYKCSDPPAALIMEIILAVHFMSLFVLYIFYTWSNFTELAVRPYL